MIDRQELLDATEGVTYVTDPSARILAIGRPAWAGFADANDAPTVADTDRYIGDDLFDHIGGDAVRERYRRYLTHLTLGDEAGRGVQFAFRCDSPDLRRDLRMSIGAIRRGAALVGFLFQTIVMSETLRPPVNLFDFAGLAAALRSHGGEPIVRMCSFCQRVAWPPDTIGPALEWIEAEDYYRRGGPSPVRISHGVCLDCVPAAMQA